MSKITNYTVVQSFEAVNGTFSQIDSYIVEIINING
jgi:hypothetical protein